MSFENPNFESADSVPQPTTPETIAQQQALLIDMQEAFTRQAEETDLAEKVRSSLNRGQFRGVTPVGQFTETASRLVPARHLHKDPQGNEIEVLSVAESQRTITEGGNPSGSYRYVKVAEISDGLLLPSGDFDNDDATQLSETVAMFDLAKTAGILPNLNPTLVMVDNPFTAMMRKPQE